MTGSAGDRRDRMTLNGAIMQLVQMRESEYMPTMFKPLFDKVIETVSECEEPGTPSAQQWIPVSERLPDSPKQVLVYARSVHYALAKYDEMREADGSYKKQWVTFDAWKPFYTIKEVIAWQPLPEPYKGGERDEQTD